MKSENQLVKVFKILTKEQKKRFYLILFCLFVGMILEALGIGVILPILDIVVSPESFKQYVWLDDFFKSISLINNQQIIIFALIMLIGVYFFKSLYLVLLSYFQNRYISFISSQISNRLFKNYLNQDFMFHNERNSSKLIKIFQIEINVVTTLLLSVIGLIAEIAIVIACFFKKACITPKEETEWLELIEHNVNILVGSNSEKIREVLHMEWLNPKSFDMKLYGEGKTSSLKIKSL